MSHWELHFKEPVELTEPPLVTYGRYTEEAPFKIVGIHVDVDRQESERFPFIVTLSILRGDEHDPMSILKSLIPKGDDPDASS